MRLIWATRGRTWGFRFLLNGGFEDPLPAYDAAFATVQDSGQIIHASPSSVAVRFDDPLGRTDRSGRLIRHDFVLLPPYPAEMATIDDARDVAWRLVADIYARMWDEERPSPVTEQDLARE